MHNPTTEKKVCSLLKVTRSELKRLQDMMESFLRIISSFIFKEWPPPDPSDGDDLMEFPLCTLFRLEFEHPRNSLLCIFELRFFTCTSEFFYVRLSQYVLDICFLVRIHSGVKQGSFQ